ncbi:hypothetical protein K9K77_03095 [Candidatus Babeliales bacterium]|nr:hypothetical protein [Candidatus Babeliales bacterium]
MKKFIFILFFLKTVQASESGFCDIIRIALSQSQQQESLLLLFIQQQKIINKQKKIVENIIDIQKKIDKKQKKLKKSLLNFENMLFGLPGKEGIFARLNQLERSQIKQTNINIFFLDYIQGANRQEQRGYFDENEENEMSEELTYDNYEIPINENNLETTG